MKSAPQMLQLLREIDDPVSFAAGSSCSESQELWLGWCQCQSGFHSPSSPSETNPLGLLLGCPRTTSLQKGSGPAACGVFWNLCSQIPSHSHDLETMALLPWSDVLGAMPQPQSLRKSHPQPWHHHTTHLMSPSKSFPTGCSSPNSGVFPHFLGHGVSVRFLGSCREYFWWSVKGSLRCSYSLLAMVWFLIYVGKSEANQDLKMLQ